MTVSPKCALFSLATLVLAAWPAVPGARAEGLSFRDATQASRLDWAMVCGSKPSTTILEVNGGGVSLLDFDNDGDLDIFLANGATLSDPEHGPGSRLYANNGSGKFHDVSDARGIGVSRWAMGVAVGDIDADGWDDIYITCYGPNILLRNDCGPGGSGKFIDISAASGTNDDRWGTSAAFGDIDGDHDLDLYVVNYLEFDAKNPPAAEGMRFMGVPVMAGPAGLTPQADVLYENNGGRFTDVTESRGVVPERPGYGLVGAIFDFDRDGRQDIFVGNDSTANFLFHNKDGKRFEEKGFFSGIACNYDGATQATMGIALADVDGNRFPDVFTTNFSSDTNTLHINLGDGFFDDRTSQYGLSMVSRPYLSWGCGFYDFDADGDEDLFISSGHVYPQTQTNKMDSDYLQPPLLFERTGKRFARTTNAGEMFHQAFTGRATAFGDLDNDGDVDVVMTALNDAVRIFENTSTGGEVMVVALHHPAGNRHALGSVVEVTIGDQVQRRWIDGGSYQSVDAPHAYFAWKQGAASAPLRVSVFWPDGMQQHFDDVRPGHFNLLNRNDKSVTHTKLAPRQAD